MSIVPAITAFSPLETQYLISHQNHRNQPSFPNTANHEINLKPIDPAVSWTSSISRRCRAGQLAEAAKEFTCMRMAGVEPNHITLVTILSGCADFPSKVGVLGPLIHGYVCKLGLDGTNVMVGTVLVEMYAKCGCVELARLVFDNMKLKNVVSWNTMIDGYMRNGEYENAIELFDEMPERNVISWTALINGFVKKGHCEDALDWFREMQTSGIQPDYVVVIAALMACVNLGTLGTGLWLHRLVSQQNLRDNVRVNNTLIDMYSRCGCIEFACQVFEKMPKRTLVSWNSIIIGFAVNGLAEKALEYFNLMQKEGIRPDGVSFTGALTACSHAGLVDEGLGYFDIMTSIYKISPRIEHYGCLVDLYSRSGKLEDALHVIENMPMKPNEVVLGSLLVACKTHGDVNLAESVLKHLVALDTNSDSNFVLISNIYAAAGRWDGASMVRRQMKDLGIQKRPGFSSIEIASDTHEFVAGDKSHSETDRIYAMLELLSFDLKLSGYVPETIIRDLHEND
ncbi:hypothetical protein SLEP1_g43313 [Rubroshorea leprosula]|uniref:Uncharacterized protein n=1 Tax=Rubroshorea leprosula TaxID=152421 RepID=A0AAV5LDB8_9ROSI|nr:hypothetical protein SLEP1_g43313 [Rubroshorea leprosula]